MDQPAAIAYRRNHRGMLAIVMLNLLLGWTGIGWLGALAWLLMTNETANQFRGNASTELELVTK